MKKLFFLPLAAAAMLMTACASDDEPNGGGCEASAAKYLAVNIQNVGAAPTTRAGESYEDGSQDENKISKVRFYFFHADGSPYILKNTSDETTSGTNANWLETEAIQNTGDKVEHPNLEKITNTVLLINGTTASAPATVIAIINPETLTNTTLGTEPINLNTLRQTLTDTKFYNGAGSKASDFVMSNSVYLDAGTSVCSAIISGHVAESKEAAEASPVDIYVERVVAKVQAAIGDGSKLEKGDNKNWSAGKYGVKVGTYGNNTDIYAVVDGWGVADEDGKAELEKQIDNSWTSATIGIDPWTTADYHRSFWSKSVPFSSGTGGNQPVNHKFTDYTATFGSPIYTLPNTPTSVSDFADPYNNYLTKFLVATHLRYQDSEGNWKNAEICSYRGVEYLGVDNLKKEIANYYKRYYTKTAEDTYETIRPEDIKFSTTQTNTSAGDLKDYQVVATLADATGKTYYVNKGTESSPKWQAVTAIDVNNSLAEVPAEVRTDGMAYYYIPIRHLADDNTKLGYYGIVRNHAYKINLTDIKGFGTPVYDPDKIIDPTVPSDKNTYLAARINVLSWRVVSQDADLNKTQK